MAHPAPELAALSWEAATVEGQPVRWLSSFEAPLLMLDPAPDQRGLVVALETAPREGRSAVAVGRSLVGHAGGAPADVLTARCLASRWAAALGRCIVGQALPGDGARAA